MLSIGASSSVTSNKPGLNYNQTDIVMCIKPFIN